MDHPDRLLDEEVKTFFHSIDPEWIVTLQTQLSQDIWTSCSLDVQLSFLYVLNAYFKIAVGKADLSMWIGVLEKMLDTLHITSTIHDKEAKHVLKLVIIWALPNKGKEVKGKKISVKYSSIFPKDICDAWIAKLKLHAASCGIKLLEPPNNADPGTVQTINEGVFEKQLSLINPSRAQALEAEEEVSFQDTKVTEVASSAAAPEPERYSINLVTATVVSMEAVRSLIGREKSKSPRGQGNSGAVVAASSSANHSNSQSNGNSGSGNNGNNRSSSSSLSSNHRSAATNKGDGVAVVAGGGSSSGAGGRRADGHSITGGSAINVVDEMQLRVVQAMCSFQAQIFKHFLDIQPRRYERWNMQIVMLSSYYLLHLYIEEKGTAGVNASLVVACIYLAGKAEYLFVKADKVRSVANRFVRSINEPVISDVKQIYAFETQLLQMLHYDVGSIPNPLRCLKALDILEARNEGQSFEVGTGTPVVAATTTTAAAAGTTTTASAIAARISARTSASKSSASLSALTAANLAAVSRAVTTQVTGTAPDGIADSTTPPVLPPPPSPVKAPSLPHPPPQSHHQHHQHHQQPPQPLPLSPNRQVVDSAAAVFLSEAFLHCAAHILHAHCCDFYLTAIVVLEKTFQMHKDDEHVCGMKVATFLHDLNQLGATVRHKCILSTSADSCPGYSQLSFIEIMSAMRSKEAFESVREDGEISSTSEEAARIENPLLPVSQRCLELTLASLTKTESIAAEKEAARLAQEALRLNEEASRRAAAAAVSANLDSKMARQQQQGARGEGGRGGGARDRRAGSPSRERDALSRQPDRRGDRSPARDRNRGRSRDRDRDRGRSRDRYRERDRDRGLSRGRSPPYSRSRSRGASPLNSRAPSRSRNASSRDRGRERERERDGNRDGTRDRSDRAHSGRIHSPDRRDRDPRGYAYDSRDIRRSPDRSRGYSRSRDRYEGGFQHSDNRYPGGDYYRYPVSRSPSRARYDDRAYGTAAVPAPIAAPVTANSRGRSRDRAQKDSGGDSGDRKGGKGGRDSRERRGGAGDAVNRASAVAAAADASNAQQDRKRGRRSRSPDPRVDPHRQSGPTVRSPPEKEARPAKRARSVRPGGREQVEEGEEAEEGCEDGEEPLNTTTAHAESTFGSIYCRDVSQASQYPNPPYLGICETSPVLPPSLAPPPPPAVASGESGGVWRDLSPQTHNTGEYSTCGGDLSPNGGFTAAPSAVDLTCLPSSSSSSSSATSSTHQVVYSLVDTETLSAPLRSSMATAVHTMSVSEGAIKSTVDLLGPADLDNVIEMSSTTDLLVETIHAAEALAPSSEKSPAADLALSQAASVDPVGVVLPLALSVLQESNSSAEGVGTSVASAPAAGSEPSNLATRTSPRTRASPRTTSPRGTRTSPRGAGGNSSKVAIETAAPAPAAGGVLEDTCAPPPGLSPGLPSAALTAPASSAAASPSSRLPVLSPVPVASATATISPTNAANSSSTPSVAVAVPSAGPAAPARVVTISASSGANHDSIIEMRAARFASPAVVPAATVPTATSSVTGPTPPHLGTTANIAPPPTSAVPSSSGASGDREGASTSPTKDSGSRHNDGDNRRNTSDQRMDRRDDSSRDQRSSKKRRRGGGGSGSSESNSRSSPDGQGQQRGGNRRHGGGTGDTSNRNINYNNSTQQAQQRNQRNSPRNHQQQNQNQQHQGTPCLSPSQLQHNEHSKSNERGGKGARRRSNEDSQQLSPLQVNPHTTGANNRDTRPNRPPTVAAESKRDLMKLLASCTGAGGSGKRNTGVVGSAASNGRTAVLYPKKDTEGAARCSDKEKVVQSVEKMGFKNLVKLSSMK